MQTPIHIVFHGIAHSDAVESQVRERAGKLEQIHPKLMRCHVTIDQPHRHKHQGNKFSVRLSLHVPGEEIVVNKDAAEDVYIAMRDASDAARRALEEAARRLRTQVRGGRAAAQGQAS
jgi:ribosome-associated translation inhibitor RaiA